MSSQVRGLKLRQEHPVKRASLPGTFAIKVKTTHGFF